MCCRCVLLCDVFFVLYDVKINIVLCCYGAKVLSLLLLAFVTSIIDSVVNTRVNEHIQNAFCSCVRVESSKVPSSSAFPCQDTIVALEAMAEFSYSQTNRAFYHLQLDFKHSQNPTWNARVTLNKDNFANLYEFDVGYIFLFVF